MDGSIGNAEHVALHAAHRRALKMEHRDLDTAIERLAQDAAHDELQAAATEAPQALAQGPDRAPRAPARSGRSSHSGARPRAPRYPRRPGDQATEGPLPRSPPPWGETSEASFGGDPTRRSRGRRPLGGRRAKRVSGGCNPPFPRSPAPSGGGARSALRGGGRATEGPLPRSPPPWGETSEASIGGVLMYQATRPEIGVDPFREQRPCVRVARAQPRVLHNAADRADDRGHHPATGSARIRPGMPATAPPMKTISTVGSGCICRLRPTVSGMKKKLSSIRTNTNRPAVQ